MQPSPIAGSPTLSGRRAVRWALAAWREQRRLAAAAGGPSWRATEPLADDWRRWLDQALMALGAALLCAGVIVFFAFNWQDLHKFSKFALLAGAVSLLAGFAWLRHAGVKAGGKGGQGRAGG